MKKCFIMIGAVAISILLSSAFKTAEPEQYISFYQQKVTFFKKEQQDLLKKINSSNFSESEKKIINLQIQKNRRLIKGVDFWLRYFEPVAYKKINGPLPVEWETEVFEKFEAPYKREGGGLTLAELYLKEKVCDKDSLSKLINMSVMAADVYLADSITSNLKTHHHFFLANRLHLLNLAAVYTTGFECPDIDLIIPELVDMLKSTYSLYQVYNKDFENYKVSADYLTLYTELISFAKNQPNNHEQFDHFRLIQQYINPLYKLNQQLILDYDVRSNNFNDYSLNKYAGAIFDKTLFRGQNNKGVYIGIDNEEQLRELKTIGRLLFYDPIISQNNKRSCASCHNPSTYFADTILKTNLQFDAVNFLPRNTPSLINVIHNHLVMLDGKHFNLENQTKDVMTNPIEMAGSETEIVKKVMSCTDYKTVFKKYLKATPQYKKVNIEHISSAMILYYADFSYFYSPFDEAMIKNKPVDIEVKNGFNLFMGKAKCGTCHFVPHFNGNKPPYISSEFEVIGTPADTAFKMLSNDKGRFLINPSKEMQSAFRSATIRNTAFTKPYMHNGAFTTLDEVVDFYDAGGGSGKGLNLSNQTLASDSLRLSKKEKKELIAFINSLNEAIPLQSPPEKLPQSKNKVINNRKPGGQY